MLSVESLDDAVHVISLTILTGAAYPVTMVTENK